jgi:thiosulfate reductase cytochrome b subunit
MRRYEHPAFVRLPHWAGGAAWVILALSGLEIFRAFPSFGDKIPQQDLFAVPRAATLGGWLGGAIQWHFTFAWVLTAAAILYLGGQLLSGNLRQVLFRPADGRGVWPMARHYFLRGPKPEWEGTYNPLQKLAYTGALALLGLSLVTGFALLRPVQLSWLVSALGGFRVVRVLHFAAMAGVFAFLPGHLVMVALHGWDNFAGMWTGWRSSGPTRR